MSKSLALPDAATGPSAKPATEARALAVASERHAVPPEMRARIADALKSGMLPNTIKTAEQAVVVALKGRELGLPMMQAFACIHVIQGVPTLSANLMLGVLFRHLPTFNYEVLERTTKVCRLRGRRTPAHSWIEAVYTMEDAVRSGDANKPNYKKIPTDMLFARAAARLCRMVAPDMLAGLYDPSEVVAGDFGTLDVIAEPEPVVPVDAPAVEAEDATEAEYEVHAPESDDDPVSRMTSQEIVAAVEEGALQGAMKRARTHLGLPSDAKGVETLRAMYRHVLAQIP